MPKSRLFSNMEKTQISVFGAESLLRHALPQTYTLLTALNRIYDEGLLAKDFEDWAKENVGRRFAYSPLDEYYYVVRLRLAQVSTQQERQPVVDESDAEIKKIQQISMELWNQMPSPVQVLSYLKLYSTDEIISGMRRFDTTLDTFTQKFAVRDLFKDNRLPGMITTAKVDNEKRTVITDKVLARTEENAARLLAEFDERKIEPGPEAF